MGANPMSEVLLARQVSTSREYIDLYELRRPEIRFVLYNPINGGEVIAELSEAEAMERLRHWPIRIPRWDEVARLPVGWISEEGRAWLGDYDAVP